MIAPQIRPSPSLRRNRWTNGTRTRSTPSPSLESRAGSTVNEPSIATATTVIVATANDANAASPVKNMPAIATRTVQPETSTERPDVAGGLERGLFASTGGTLFALPLQVEHRVVDAHGEPDQKDDCRHGVVHREHLADEGDQAERGKNRRDAEQQRNAGRNERAEREHEDDQGQRDRVEPGLLQIVLEGTPRSPSWCSRRTIRRRTRGSPPATPPHGPQSGRSCRPPHRTARGSRRLRALNACQRRSGRRFLRRTATPLLRPRRGREAGRSGHDHGLERRVVGGERRALDQDRLAGRLLEVFVEDRVGASRLAGSGRLEDDLLMGEAKLTANSSTANASQPKIAFLRWWALQRAMRAARFGLLTLS